MSDILYDQKWHRLLNQSFLFQHIPFVDFVLVAGSMALGNVHENSDFDVIVAAKFGRLYTARFFCLAVYRLLGWRRNVSKNSSKNGFCFNHFVTEKSYCLQPPYNFYWRKLYQHLVPVFGDVDKIKEFFKENEKWIAELSLRSLDGTVGGEVISSSLVREEEKIATPNHSDCNQNDWVREDVVEHDLRFEYKNSSALKIFLEKILLGKMGDWLERRAKNYQIKKIKTFLKKHPPGYKPRLIYNNEEVELHLDTRRTELF